MHTWLSYYASGAIVGREDCTTKTTKTTEGYVLIRLIPLLSGVDLKLIRMLIPLNLDRTGDAHHSRSQ